jgi:hypothetical protein
MNTPPKTVAAWLLTAVLAAEVLLIASKARLDVPFLAPALLAVVVVQIRSCRSYIEVLWAIPVALALALSRFGFHLRPLYENPAGLSPFLGLASLFLMGIAVLNGRPQELRDRVEAFGVAVAVPVFVTLAAVMLPGTADAHPRTLDRILYAFDGSLGVQPSFIIGRLLTHLPWLSALAGLFYQQVPAAVLILYASTMGARDRRKPNILLLFGVASLLGYLLYSLVPAAGPVDLFPSRFPNSAPPLSALELVPSAIPAGIPRNAMPSLHLAWAVLLWWNARSSGILLRAGYLLYLALTILATLGSGEHYLIDLVVAVPFTLAVQAAFSVPLRTLPKCVPFWGGAIGTLGWLGFLRFALPVWLGSTVLDWCLIVVTLVGSVILERQTHRSSPATASQGQSLARERLEASSTPF